MFKFEENMQNWIQPKKDLKDFAFSQRERFFLEQLDNLPKEQGLDEAIDSIKSSLRDCLLSFDSNSLGEIVGVVLEAKKIIGDETIEWDDLDYTLYDLGNKEALKRNNDLLMKIRRSDDALYRKIIALAKLKEFRDRIRAIEIAVSLMK